MYKFHRDIQINDSIVLNEMNSNVRDDEYVIVFVFQIIKLDLIFVVMLNHKYLINVQEMNFVVYLKVVLFHFHYF